MPPSSRRKFVVSRDGMVKLRGTKQNEDGDSKRKRARKWLRKKLRAIDEQRSPTQTEMLHNSID